MKKKPLLIFSNIIVSFLAVGIVSCKRLAHQPAWEKENPVMPLPKPPLGIDSQFSELENPPTPERVRLGRWLFFDSRVSGDRTISCGTCHRPENAFSEPTPVSTGIHGQKGTRKAPSFVNQAWTLYPNFFWDGRAKSLEEQAAGPVANPIEMGNTHQSMVGTFAKIPTYKKYFKEAFGSDEITLDRITKAIADYERTRMSGNSAYDKFSKDVDKNALSTEAQKGMDLFFGKAECNQCHLGQNFTDSQFHNLGIGWNSKTKSFADEGRFKVTQDKKDLGAFKTPTLREITKHGPYMHDGSLATLKDVVDHYNKGGTKNPNLSPKIRKLNLKPDEVAALIKFMDSLEGGGYQDTAPKTFPQ